MKHKINIKHSCIVIIIVFVASCSNKKSIFSKELSIINNSFLEIIDTVAYKYHSLRPAPNGEVFNNNDSLNITIFYKQTDLLKKKTNIISELNKQNNVANYSNYIKLINSYVDTSENFINVDSIKNTGRYRLFSSHNFYSYKQAGMIGHVVFSRIAFDEKKGIAIFFITVMDNIKVGIEKLILLKKEGDNWKKYQEFTMDIW
ncbi:MAG: hypothetical protein JSR12_01550 [Bacteroidetes bacterium]|nr:hypothetical protein [Bacteroidota bacterium]